MKIYVSDYKKADENSDGFNSFYPNYYLKKIKYPYIEYNSVCEIEGWSVPKPINEKCVHIVGYSNNIFRLTPEALDKWFEQVFSYGSYIIFADTGHDEPARFFYRKIYLDNQNILKVFQKYSKNIVFYHSDIIEPAMKQKYNEFNFVHTYLCDDLLRLPTYVRDSYKLKTRTDKFLCTTVIKERRKHRELLLEEFNNRKISNYIGTFHPSRQAADNNWIGDKSNENSWHDGHISWDLYDQVSFEVVPETFFEFITHVTEKTFKPMIAKVPFIILANSEFYRELKNKGFKTFDSLIDESFAYETDLNLRVKKFVDTIVDIQKNGSLEFYRAARDICDYNFDQCLYVAEKEKYNQYINNISIDKYIKDFKFQD